MIPKDIFFALIQKKIIKLFMEEPLQLDVSIPLRLAFMGGGQTDKQTTLSRTLRIID